MESRLDQLLHHSCPSIAYRTRKEILQEHLSEQQENEYRQRILASPRLRRVLEWQGADGYFGTRLHTAPTGSPVWPHEGCVRYLLEMGLPPDFEPLQKALRVLLVPGWQKEGTGSRAAQAMGFEIIRAALFAQAGLTGYDFVRKWADEALEAFKTLAMAESLRDIAAENKNGRLVFLGGRRIPTVFHLRMLAYTDEWRTAENKRMLAAAFEKLYCWLPLPQIYIKAGSQLVAPLGNLAMPLNREPAGPYGFWWLHFHELAARAGMLGKGSPFRKNFDLMDDARLEQLAGSLTRAAQTRGYTGWGPYSGLALEDEWKSKQARLADLSFRLCLTRHYADGADRACFQFPASR